MQRSSSRKRKAQQRKRKNLIVNLIVISAVLVVFAILMSVSSIIACVWLFFACVIYLSVLFAILHHKQMGTIVKIEIVNTVVQGRRSIVTFKETYTSGLTELVQCPSDSTRYQTELLLMNQLENSAIIKARGN